MWYEANRRFDGFAESLFELSEFHQAQRLNHREQQVHVRVGAVLAGDDRTEHTRTCLPPASATICLTWSEWLRRRRASGEVPWNRNKRETSGWLRPICCAICVWVMPSEEARRTARTSSRRARDVTSLVQCATSTKSTVGPSVAAVRGRCVPGQPHWIVPGLVDTHPYCRYGYRLGDRHLRC